MVTNADTPTYNNVVREQHIVPEHIYARCVALARFDYPTAAPPAKRKSTAPRPGQKPTRKRK